MLYVGICVDIYTHEYTCTYILLGISFLGMRNTYTTCKNTSKKEKNPFYTLEVLEMTGIDTMRLKKINHNFSNYAGNKRVWTLGH